MFLLHICLSLEPDVMNDRARCDDIWSYFQIIGKIIKAGKIIWLFTIIGETPHRISKSGLAKPEPICPHVEGISMRYLVFLFTMTSSTTLALPLVWRGIWRRAYFAFDIWTVLWTMALTNLSRKGQEPHFAQWSRSPGLSDDSIACLLRSGVLVTVPLYSIEVSLFW